MVKRAVAGIVAMLAPASFEQLRKAMNTTIANQSCRYSYCSIVSPGSFEQLCNGHCRITPLPILVPVAHSPRTNLFGRRW